MKVNKNVYLLVYALNNITKTWLDNTNDLIKAKGIENVITNNKDNAITVRLDNAQAKYSIEDKAKIDAYKRKFTPINVGEKTLKVITVVSKNAVEQAKDIITNLENAEDKTTRIAASKLANKRA